jgi:hypothetical protein
LSSHEVNQPGSYRVTDTTVVAQFKVLEEPSVKDGAALIGIQGFGLDSLFERAGEIYFPSWTTLDIAK